MIVHSNDSFAIQWEILEIIDDSSVYGPITMIFEGNIYPRKIEFNYTLSTVFSNLKDSFYHPDYPGGSSGNELGSRNVNFDKLDYGEETDIFDLEMTELGDFYSNDDRGGLRISVGYYKELERVFVSSDNGKNYQEFTFAKGTVESVITQLPSQNELIKQIAKCT